MSGNNTVKPSGAPRSRVRSRRLRTVLAAGLVVGTGVTAVVANWSDAVSVDGTFNTGQFELQGARFPDIRWENKDTRATGAALVFKMDPTKMWAGQTTYSPFSVGTSPNTEYDGTFVLSLVEHDGGGLQNVLTYKIYNVPNGVHGANCSKDDPPQESTLWAGGNTAHAMDSSVPVGGTTPLPVGARQGAGGNGIIQRMCFAVTLGDPSKSTAENDAAVTAAIQADGGPTALHGTKLTWLFTGTSVDN